MAKSETKIARVFEAKLQSDGSYQRLSARTWDRELRAIAEENSLTDRKIDDVYYDPVEQDGHYLLGMHRPVDGSFRTEINEDASSITDVMSDDPSGRKLADSSVVLFSDTHHVFFFASGGRNAPPASAVLPFLREYFPGRDDQRWKVDPYFDRGQTERLKEAKGLVKFATKFSTQRDLFTVPDDGSGPAAFADRIADAVGQDVEIEISIKLPKQSRGRRATAKLLNLVRNDLSRTAGEGSNATAEAVMDEELTEELWLVAHKMAAKFELHLENAEHKVFTDLLKGLASVSSELNDKVKAIEQG